jgi:putative transcriptional regulator
LYLAKNRIPVTAFAERIGISRQALYRYMDGTRFPEQSIRLAIGRATHGAVTANDFENPALVSLVTQ